MIQRTIFVCSPPTPIHYAPSRDLFCFAPPVFLQTSSYNYMLLHITLLCDKIARAPGGQKIFMLTISWGQNRIGIHSVSGFQCFFLIFMTPVTNYLLLCSTLLCNKATRAPGVHKRFMLTKLGGGQNRSQNSPSYRARAVI